MVGHVLEVLLDPLALGDVEHLEQDARLPPAAHGATHVGVAQRGGVDRGGHRLAGRVDDADLGLQRPPRAVAQQRDRLAQGAGVLRVDEPVERAAAQLLDGRADDASKRLVGLDEPVVGAEHRVPDRGGVEDGAEVGLGAADGAAVEPTCGESGEHREHDEDGNERGHASSIGPVRDRLTLGRANSHRFHSFRAAARYAVTRAATTPATISTTAARRPAVTGSPWRAIPSETAPIAPMPVKTA